MSFKFKLFAERKSTLSIITVFIPAVRDKNARDFSVNAVIDRELNSMILDSM